MTAELSPEQIVDGLRQRLQFARTGAQAALYESAIALITRQQQEIARRDELAESFIVTMAQQHSEIERLTQEIALLRAAAPSDREEPK